MSNQRQIIDVTYHTNSFLPHTSLLFINHIHQLFHLTRETFPEAEFQIGREILEDNIKTREDLDNVIKKLHDKSTEFHNLYIHIKTQSGEREPNILLMEFSAAICSLRISYLNDDSMLKVYHQIRQIIEKSNIYKLYRKRSVFVLTMILDISLSIYLLLLKDWFERLTSTYIPMSLLLLSGLLINLAYLVPHGKNKFFLQEAKSVSPLKKNRETLILGSFLAFISIIFIIVLFNTLTENSVTTY